MIVLTQEFTLWAELVALACLVAYSWRRSRADRAAGIRPAVAERAGDVAPVLGVVLMVLLVLSGGLFPELNLVWSVAVMLWYWLGRRPKARRDRPPRRVG